MRRNTLESQITDINQLFYCEHLINEHLSLLSIVPRRMQETLKFTTTGTFFLKRVS